MVDHRVGVLDDRVPEVSLAGLSGRSIVADLWARSPGGHGLVPLRLLLAGWTWRNHLGLHSPGPHAVLSAVAGDRWRHFLEPGCNGGSSRYFGWRFDRFRHT